MLLGMGEYIIHYLNKGKYSSRRHKLYNFWLINNQQHNWLKMNNL